MKIPSSCVPWIKLQRHGIKYKYSETEYISEIKKEYKLMLPFLPESADSILDIGCGVAGIDVLLSKHYNNPKVYLLDAFLDNNVIYGFTNEKSLYNSLLATQDMMKLNCIMNYYKLHITVGIENLENIDIIISTLSCGYHYLVDTYLEKINKALSENGILIIDIRENTDGIEKVKKVLPKINIISTYNKSNRICARRL